MEPDVRLDSKDTSGVVDDRTVEGILASGEAIEVPVQEVGIEVDRPPRLIP